MSSPITRHIGLALLLPVMGSLLAVIVFYGFLNQTEPDNAFINIAGRQRMLSQQLVTFANMVHIGQEEDRGELRQAITHFDQSLEVLKHGGQVIGHTLPPSPPEVISKIMVVNKLWKELKPKLELIANKPIKDTGAIAAYQTVMAKGEDLTAFSNQIVLAYVARGNHLRKSMLSYLVAFATLAFVALILGTWVTRRYSAEKRIIETRLREARDELEKRVAERTTELVDARDKAELANHAKSDFLRSMSHELRTPLNAILGYSQLLIMDEESSLSEEHHLFVQDIMKAGYHLLDLVNDVLDLARIEAGHLDIKIEEVGLATLAEDCVSQVDSALALHRNITIDNRITNPDIYISGDQRRIRQVLINLLSNAVKYNRDGGMVTVENIKTQKDLVRIEVSDNGLGISEEELSRLFEPFERLTHKNSAIEGAGIGLYVSRQLVESMHGHIGVESKKDKGSTFWFELPRAEKKHEHKTTIDDKAPPSRVSGSTRRSLLYIEDNPSNVQVVKHALEKHSNIEFLFARSAEEGLKIAEKEQPDLILMDIMLPGIDGVTANNLLKESESTRYIPVIAISANVMHDDVDEALEHGFKAYLTKPIDINDLLKIVNETISG